MYKIEYVNIYLKENDRNAELMAYAKWLNSNEIDDCQMMASMNSCGILDCQGIMDNVQDLFGNQFFIGLTNGCPQSSELQI